MSAQRRPTSSTPPRKPPTAWIVGGVVALIVLLAGIVAITSSGGDDDDDATPVATAPGAADEGASAGTGGDTDTDVSLGGGTAPTAAAGNTPGPVVGEVGTVTVTGTDLPSRTDDSDPAVGMQAPTLAGITFDGSPVTIAPGKPTLVVFFAHWCPHCQAEVPRLVEWSASGEAPANVDVVGISTAAVEQRDNYPPSEWLAREGWPHPVLLDDEASTAAVAMGIDAYPFFLLLDETGEVLYRDSGEIDTDELTERIESALAA